MSPKDTTTDQPPGAKVFGNKAATARAHTRIRELETLVERLKVRNNELDLRLDELGRALEYQRNRHTALEDREREELYRLRAENSNLRAANYRLCKGELPPEIVTLTDELQHQVARLTEQLAHAQDRARFHQTRADDAEEKNRILADEVKHREGRRAAVQQVAGYLDDIADEADRMQHQHLVDRSRNGLQILVGLGYHSRHAEGG